MSNTIEGGGQSSIDPSLPNDVEALAEENAAEIIKRGGGNHQKNADTLHSLESEKISVQELVETVDSEIPVLPKGKAHQPVSSLVQGSFNGADEVKATLSSQLPQELASKISGDGAAGNPDLVSVKQTIDQVANAAALSTQFLQTVESSPEKAVQSLKPMQPGAIDPLASPAEQNAQVAANSIEMLENQHAMGEEILKGLPEGPAKDSLSAYLAKIAETIVELQNFLETMNEGDLYKPKYLSAGDDKAQLYQAKKAEAQQEAGGLGGFLGDVAGVFGGLGDLVMDTLNFLSFGLFDALLGGLDGIGDLLDLEGLLDMFDFGGLLDGIGDLLDIGGVLDGLLENPESLIFAAGGAVLLTVLFPLLGVWGLVAGAALGLLLAEMATGKDNFLSSLLKDTPLVGDLYKMISEPLGGMFESLGIRGLFGGGEGDSKSSSTTREKRRSRNAGTAAVTSDIQASTSQHAAELEGAQEEEASMKAQISKLLSVLRSIASGNASPDQLAGVMIGTLGKLTGGDLQSALGPQAAHSLQQALDAGMNGDRDRMFSLSADALHVSNEQMVQFSEDARNLIPEFGANSTVGGGFILRQAA